MVEEFKTQWLRFRQSEKVRLFRVDTVPAMQHDLVRLLRAFEMSPDNRSPYLIVTPPFTKRNDYYAAASEQIKTQYCAIREALTKEGVTFGALVVSLTGQETPEESFVKHLKTMWERVQSQFEYLMVILLPAAIEDKKEWPKTVERLYELMAPLKARLAVADMPGDLLAPLCARLSRRSLTGRFSVSDKTVQEYLFKVAAGGWAAVAPKGAEAAPGVQGVAPSRSLPTVPKTAAAPANGAAPKVFPPDQAKRFRALMAASAAASAENDPKRAIEALQEARLVCEQHGLAAEQAIVLMAIGNTHVATNQFDPAIEHYEKSIAVARKGSVPVVTAQAGLALGSTLFRKRDYTRAALAYEQAAEDAKACESDILVIEALRMAGTCHNLRKEPEEAMRCWKAALETSRQMSPGELQISTWEQVGQAFVELCRKRGLSDQAKSVAGQIEAMKRQAVAVPAAH
jgi:hypothetical protein